MDSIRAQFTFPDNDAAQAALDTLKECDCCTTHQINKPFKLKLWTELHPTHNWDNSCDCNCRHRARWICREMCGFVAAPVQHRDQN